MDNMTISIETQRKFEFFVLGLTFGILSVAINSYRSEPICWLNLVEVSAWCILFFGGISGLYRWRIVPEIYNRYHLKQKIAAGEVTKMSEGEYQKGLQILQSFEKKTKRRHDIFWICFVIGTFMLFAKRAIPIVLHSL